MAQPGRPGATGEARPAGRGTADGGFGAGAGRRPAADVGAAGEGGGLVTAGLVTAGLVTVGWSPSGGHRRLVTAGRGEALFRRRRTVAGGTGAAATGSGARAGCGRPATRSALIWRNSSWVRAKIRAGSVPP